MFRFYEPFKVNGFDRMNSPASSTAPRTAAQCKGMQSDRYALLLDYCSETYMRLLQIVGVAPRMECVA